MSEIPYAYLMCAAVYFKTYTTTGTRVNKGGKIDQAVYVYGEEGLDWSVWKCGWVYLYGFNTY